MTGVARRILRDSYQDFSGVCTYELPGDIQAEWISSELFDDDFMSCMDEMMSELDEALKSYSVLTVVNGQMNPCQKKNIIGLIQSTRDQYRTGMDPTEAIYLVANIANHIKRYTNHEAYVKKATNLAETAKPEQFTEKIKLIHWFPTLINF